LSVSKRLLFLSDEVISALLRAGFEIAPQTGSHASLKRKRAGGGHDVVVVIMGYSEIPKGTFRGILKQANITYEEVLALARVKRRGRRSGK